MSLIAAGNSFELSKQPIEFGRLGYDKIFITARVGLDDGVWYVFIDKNMPLVALNEDVRQEFGLKCPTVKEMRNPKRDEYTELSLVSGGSFIWITAGGEKRLVLLQRDMQAKCDAGLFTGAAGRCDRLIHETCLGETIAEMAIIIAKTFPCGQDHYLSVAFYRQGENRDKIIDAKLLQAKAKVLEYRAKGLGSDADLFERIKNPEDVRLVDIDACKDENCTGVVATYFGEIEVEVVKGCIAYFDGEHNTLEVRKILNFTLAEDEYLVGVFDGENFGRKVAGFASLQEIDPALAVPTLKYYIESQGQ